MTFSGHSLRLLCAVLAAAGLALTVFAGPQDTRIRRVSRTVAPASPVYAGVRYTLTLTIVTEEDCEVSNLSAKHLPEEPVASQHAEVKDGLRTTTIVWFLVDARPKIVAFPEEPMGVELTRAHQAGFMRLVRRERTTVTLPAFSYEVAALPKEAEGLPAGTFALSLTADRPTFVPGDVRRLRAELRSLDGSRIPELTFEPVFDASAGVFYDFRPKLDAPDTTLRKQAEAYFVANADTPITLTLKPLKVFDPVKRRVHALSAPPLVLRPAEDDAAAPTEGPVAADRTPDGQQMLRFAPDGRSPLLGAVPPEGLVTESAYEGWIRVRAADGMSGWMRAPEAAKAAPEVPAPEAPEAPKAAPEVSKPEAPAPHAPPSAP